jgi:serine/threonine protein kinase/tetratricopeptide (TPR) repeat protein
VSWETEAQALKDARWRTYNPEMSLPPGARLGPYEIVALLGAGGMGQVYRAVDPRLGREVAVKTLPASFAADPERVRRFEVETRVVGALNHPNVLAIYDVGTHEGAPYFVSELLEGASLRERLANGPFPPRKTVQLAIDIASGLAAAHAKGIVHRDLKPENVFLTRDGRVKILDFGLARSPVGLSGALGPTSQMDTPTSPGAVLGTLGYASPEQLRGQAADHRSDLFALGAVLYEMVSGRRAFHGATPADTLAAVLRGEPSPVPRGLPSALERILGRCLEKEPDQRFHSAHDLGLALESAFATLEEVGARERSTTKSVAVLPFKDLARDPANAHLGLGLADATITELALLRSLVVRPTSRILHYQDAPAGPQQAGRELEVDAVVDGSFQRAGSRLRVTVQLVDTQDGHPLWAKKIDASLDDVFLMQDEVSRSVAEALRVELTPAESDRLGKGPATSGEAYDLYMRGKVRLFRDSLADMVAAVDFFEKARTADPRFALAWAGLADAYARIAYEFQPEGDWHVRARAMSDKALDLDPGLPEGHYVRGRLLWSPPEGWDHAGALRELMSALAARPNLDDAHLKVATILYHVGLVEESEHHLHRALAITPGHPQAVEDVAAVFYHQARYEETAAAVADSIRIVRTAWSYYLLGHAQIRLGRRPAALETVDALSRQANGGEILALTVQGVLAALDGEAAEAKRLVEEAERRRKAYGNYHHAQYDAGCIHALLGEPDRAVAWLEAAARNGYPCAALFARDPLLEPLRGHAGFQELLVRLQDEAAGYAKVYGELRSAGAGSDGDPGGPGAPAASSSSIPRAATRP